MDSPAGPRPGPDQIAAAKRAWRERLLTARRSRDGAAIGVARAALTRRLEPELTGAGTIAAYQPMRVEPLDPGLAVRLTGRGARVLLPVVRADGALDWSVFEPAGPRTRGPLGITEPAGPRLGPDALAEADVVLVPALAVDRRGFRLGHGGGYYDRALGRLADRAISRGPTGERPAFDRPRRLIAVVFDDEFVEDVPVGPDDVPVTHVVTPSGGVRRLPEAEPGGSWGS